MFVPVGSSLSAKERLNSGVSFRTSAYFAPKHAQESLNRLHHLCPAASTRLRWLSHVNPIFPSFGRAGPLVRADARPPALLALASLALVLADARAPALLALDPPALVRADAHPRRLPFSSFGCRHGRHRRQDTLQIRVCSMTSLSSSSSRHAVNMTALGLNVVDVAAFEDVVTLSLWSLENLLSSSCGKTALIAVGLEGVVTAPSSVRFFLK